VTVLNVKMARSIWLVDSRDLNPHRIDIMPMLAAIKDRYRFQEYPKTPEQANEYDAKGIVFMNGSFAVENHHYTIVKATMFGDGIVVDSNVSTDFSEAFLADVLEFLSGQFELTYRPEMIHSKIYLSELVLQTDKDLHRLFAPLAAIKEKLDLLTGRDFQPAGFGFSVDPKASASQPAPFRFEREILKPFEQQRFYSAAPLRTSQHEDLLREMEALL
jgi:hypothetical protein